MTPKTERFEMRLEPMTLERIDAWREQQSGVPTRAEAVRRLIEFGLSDVGRRGPRLSDGERLIAYMLCGIVKGLDIETELEPGKLQEIIVGGHDWALDWEYPGIFDGHRVSYDTVKEVLDILGMWDDIERAVEGFKKTDRARLAEGAKIFGPMASFPGFCGNYETEHLTASGFLVQKLGRFERFFDRDLNSHIPLVDAYRRMLALFDPMRSGLSGRHLTFDEVISLCQAAVHPDHR